MIRKHFIKVGQVLEQLKKEIKEERDNTERKIYEEHTRRVGS